VFLLWFELVQVKRFTAAAADHPLVTVANEPAKPRHFVFFLFADFLSVIVVVVVVAGVMRVWHCFALLKLVQLATRAILYLL